MGAAGELHILIVDDDEDGAKTLGLLLEAQGHRTATAHSGAGALRYVQSTTPDVVLFDIDLPDTCGYEVANEIQLRHPDMSLVAVSGWDRASDEPGDDPFVAYFVKPLDYEALGRLLDDLRHDHLATRLVDRAPTCSDGGGQAGCR